jgi:hypothetical protein
LLTQGRWQHWAELSCSLPWLYHPSGLAIIEERHQKIDRPELDLLKPSQTHFRVPIAEHSNSLLALEPDWLLRQGLMIVPEQDWGQ